MNEVNFYVSNVAILIFWFLNKIVNTVPVPTIPAGMYTGIKTLMFRIGLNIGQFRAISAGT